MALTRRGFVALTAAAGAVRPAAAADDIVLGGGLTLSGTAAAYGEDGRVGADIAVAEFNAKGGVLGRKLRVDYDDTGMERARAVAIYRKYAARPDVVAMVSVSSVELVALDPLSNELKLPIVSIGSAATFARFSPYTFRLQEIVGKAMPGHCHGNRGWRQPRRRVRLGRDLTTRSALPSSVSC